MRKCDLTMCPEWEDQIFVYSPNDCFRKIYIFYLLYPVCRWVNWVWAGSRILITWPSKQICICLPHSKSMFFKLSTCNLYLIFLPPPRTTSFYHHSLLPWLLLPTRKLKYLYISSRRKNVSLHLVQPLTYLPIFLPCHTFWQLSASITDFPIILWIPLLSLHWKDSLLTFILQMQWSFFNSYFKFDPAATRDIDDHSHFLHLPFLWFTRSVLSSYIPSQSSVDVSSSFTFAFP